MIDEKKVIQEFKKSLWHDPKEEPKGGRDVLVQYSTDNECRVWHLAKYNLVLPYQRNDWTLGITRWCYVDDILPKEGGEE